MLSRVLKSLRDHLGSGNKDHAPSVVEDEVQQRNDHREDGDEQEGAGETGGGTSSSSSSAPYLIPHWTNFVDEDAKLYVTHHGHTHEGVVKSGSVIFDGFAYNSLSGFALACLRKNSPERRSVSGWKVVRTRFGGVLRTIESLRMERMHPISPRAQGANGFSKTPRPKKRAFSSNGGARKQLFTTVAPVPGVGSILRARFERRYSTRYSQSKRLPYDYYECEVIAAEGKKITVYFEDDDTEDDVLWPDADFEVVKAVYPRASIATPEERKRKKRK